MPRQQFYYANPARIESAGSESDNGFHPADIPDLEENIWDAAHRLKKVNKTGYIEPDLAHQNPASEKLLLEKELNGELEGAALREDQYDPKWPFPADGSKPDKEIWHVGPKFSQLRPAWDQIKDLNNIVRIAHFDTGYDPDHITFPKANIDFALQMNFVECNDSAVDPASAGGLNNPGHGTGTLSILAGNTVDLPEYHYNDYLGVHHNIRIVPVRISKSVVLWKNKALVDALDYVTGLYDKPDQRVHIVSMSMGGLPSKAWADAVNSAYEKGIFIVTAAGNNFGRATPTTLVYPARFPPITAACGVNYDYSPYIKPFDLADINVMEGNFGPIKAMGKAVAAFTPNVPWAVIHTKTTVSINGAGTSSATPQIAAAAALYYQKYFDKLSRLSGWQIVEKIRGAMFQSADKQSISANFKRVDIPLYFGNGILKAADMLAVDPASLSVEKAEPAEISFPFFKLITGTDILEGVADEALTQMYETETLQLIAQSKSLQDILNNEETNIESLSLEKQVLFFETILKMGSASNELKRYISFNVLPAITTEHGN